MDLYLLKYPYRKILLPLAQKVKFIHPDVLSYLATIVSLITGLTYYFAAHEPILLIWAVGLIFFRMTLNTIDGVIAIERGNLTLKGEIVNALPDRYSDIFLLMGISFSNFCRPELGFFAMASMFLVSYTGILGKALGVEWQHHGPLGKVERLVLVMIFTLLQYLRRDLVDPGFYIVGFHFQPLECCMVLFVVLGQWSVVNRLKGMLRQIRRKEWDEKERQNFNSKVSVLYESRTGNTYKIAEQLATSMNAKLINAHEDSVHEIEKADLVIFCTPNIRAKPAEHIKQLLQMQIKVKQYAVFVTFGMPVWGQISKEMNFRYFRKMLGKKALGVSACKGFHAKYKTYKGHPNTIELNNAYLFGIWLARQLQREPRGLYE